jgi:HEPN domain-containing protein
MPPEPGSPEDWLRYARSDLAMARRVTDGEILIESLCFHAQQAVEKALKAVLVRENIRPPRTQSRRSDGVPTIRLEHSTGRARLGGSL